MACVAWLLACRPQNWNPQRREVPLLPAQPYNYNDPLPPHLDDGQSGTINNHLATLGRVLFYDEKLSSLNNVSCGTCHKQRFCFSDGLALTPGVMNKLTDRNTMQLVNVRQQTFFLWDSRAGTIPQQVLMPITNHIEMGITDMDALMQRISAIDYYPALFEAAFGSNEVNSEKVAMAMAEFVRSMVSYRSKFDRAYNILTGEPDSTVMNKEEIHGFHLFNHKFQCDKCHGGANFAGSGGSDAANIGLDMHYEDPGMGGWSGIEEFNGVFKVPALRNVMVTGPFMHDGRFATIEETIEHYSSGIQPHVNLDFRLVNALPPPSGPPGSGIAGGFHMTAQEKHALIAFMKTLTDDYFLNDVRYSDPFVLE